MSNEVAHKSWWQIFEVVFGIPFLIAVALQWIFPVSFPRGFFVPVFITLGGVLIFVGFILVTLARHEFTKYGQPTDPGYPTSGIVTTGVFSISRNPLYLGGVCLLAGISLAFNLPWAFISLLPSVIACHNILIVPEEKYLAVRFGAAYQTYSSSVRRWLGRK